MQIFFTEPSLLDLLRRIGIFQVDLHHRSLIRLSSGFNEGEGLGATLRGVAGLKSSGLDGSSEVGREETLLSRRGPDPHQPPFLLKQVNCQDLSHDHFNIQGVFFTLDLP